MGFNVSPISFIVEISPHILRGDHFIKIGYAERNSMARRDESIFNLLVNYPWWVSVIVSSVVYVFLKFILPTIEFQNLFINSFVNGISPFALIIALFLLIQAPISAINSWRKRRLLDKQKDIDSIQGLNWREFEELVGEAYRRQGYAVSENPAAGPDEGIDLALKKDGNLLLVQCKHWRSTKVGVNIVREVYGVMTTKRATSAVLITSGIFTQEAKNFATDKPIDLVDGGQLLQLIGNVQRERTISSKPISDNSCPKCGADMVLRTAQKGSNPGQKFWGCSNFPRCRATKPAL
jgi:restriction system protein